MERVIITFDLPAEKHISGAVGEASYTLASISEAFWTRTCKEKFRRHTSDPN